MSNPHEIEITCPKCGNIGQTSGRYKKDKCHYNPAKNVWSCFLCGSKGWGNPLETVKNVIPFNDERFQATEELVKAYEDELTNSEDAKQYLGQRLGDYDWRSFRLGYDPGRHAIVIPTYNLDGDLCGLKYRFIGKIDKRYISEPGSQFGFYHIAGETSQLLIVEGEFDAMAARTMGFTGTIVATQTNRLTQAQQDNLLKFAVKADRIIIAPDADKAGQELIATLNRIGLPKEKVIELTGYPETVKDLGDFAEQKLSKKFLRLVSEAKTELEKLSYGPFDRIHETWEYLANPLNTNGWSTGFAPLDNKLGGGLIPHMLTAFSAPGKSGKTTFIIQLIVNLIQQNLKTAFISLEMSPTTHVVPSLLSILMQRNIRRMHDKEQILKLIESSIDDLKYMNNLTFMDKYGATPAELIDSWIRAEAAKGVKVFFLDHVGYSLMDIRDVNEHSNLSKRLRAITRELPVHIFAVVQPKQTLAGQRVTKHDLYGSVTWSQDVNQVLTLEKGENYQSIVRVTDSHNPLAKPSDEGIIFFYDSNTCGLTLTR